MQKLIYESVSLAYSNVKIPIFNGKKKKIRGSHTQDCQVFHQWYILDISHLQILISATGKCIIAYVA